MEDNQIKTLNRSVESIKKKIYDEEKQKKYGLFYNICFSLFILSLTLFYTNHLLEKTFSQMGEEPLDIMYQIPFLGDLQLIFLIGAILSLTASIIIFIIIVIKKRLFYKLSSFIIKKFNEVKK